jgi:predicted permease
MGNIRDLRQAIRSLARSPLQTGVLVLILAAGIAVNGTLFGFVEGIWTRPTPGVHDPTGLVHIYARELGASRQSRALLSYPELVDLRARLPAFASLAASERRGPRLRGEGFTDSTISEIVTDNYFDVLGVQPLAGRLFGGENAPDADEPILVMSAHYWRRRFGGDPSLIGKTVQLKSTLFTVMGIAAPEFRGSALDVDVDLWIPRSSWRKLNPGEDSQREYDSQSVFGRLQSGATIAEAQAQLDVAARSLAAAYPASNTGRGLLVVSDRERRLTASGHAPVMIMAIAGLVLLVACLNVGGLLLARHQERRDDAAIRLAIGCTRGRLVRHLLAEGAVVAVFAVIASIPASAVGLRILLWLLRSPGSPLQNEFRLDARVIASALILGCISILLAALLPAVRASRSDAGRFLHGSGPGITHRRRTLGLLAGAQIAVAILLVTITGLFVRSFIRVVNANLGFARRDILVVQVTPGRSSDFYGRLLDRLRGLPQVRRAAIALRAPLAGYGGGMDEEIAVPDRPTPGGERAPRVKLAVVGDGYFDLLGIRVRSGRTLQASDSKGSEAVVIVNATMARWLWPSGKAEGATLRIGAGSASRAHRVIGVVDDTRVNTIVEDPEPYMYLAASQRPRGPMALMIETRDDPLAWADAARGEIVALDPNAAVTNVTTMGALVRERSLPQRSGVTIVGLLGLVSLLLAAAGLQALMTSLVIRRRRDLAIRLAVGARQGEILAMVLRHGLTIALVGAGAGLAAAAALTPALANVLYGVTPHDGWTYAAALLVVAIVAALATLVPARRATQVDPAEVLRWE